MSSLPDVREFDDKDLAESPSDSEEVLAAKYKERKWWRLEHRKHEECERQEREEHKCEECERCECEEHIACKTHKREVWKEWEQREACEEVHCGKVSIPAP